MFPKNINYLLITLKSILLVSDDINYLSVKQRVLRGVQSHIWVTDMDLKHL